MNEHGNAGRWLELEPIETPASRLIEKVENQIAEGESVQLSVEEAEILVRFAKIGRSITWGEGITD